MLAEHDAASLTPNPTLEPIGFRFSGTASDYFRIWIVNTVLSILTLGIYSAWAKVRTLKYLYGATELDGARFDYHADPLVILRSRIIAAVLLVAYLVFSNVMPLVGGLIVLLIGFASPWLIVMARRFALRNTSYRNVRFSFAGEVGEAYSVVLGGGFLSVITLGLAWPYARWWRASFLVDSTWWGNLAFRTPATAGSFYIAYLIVGGVALLLFAGMGAFGALVGYTGALEEGSAEAGAIVSTAVFFATYLLVLVFLAGLLQAQILRRTADGLRIGDHEVQVDFRPLRVALISVTNAMAILFSFGLLIPWATIRLYRYQLEHCAVLPAEPLDRVQARIAAEQSAAGEEVGDAFDLDLGI